MTIQNIVAGLQAQYGNKWPREIIGLTIGLAAIRYTQRTAEEQEQYLLLRQWLLETVEAGIASKQGNPTEH